MNSPSKDKYELSDIEQSLIDAQADKLDRIKKAFFNLASMLGKLDRNKNTDFDHEIVCIEQQIDDLMHHEVQQVQAMTGYDLPISNRYKKWKQQQAVIRQVAEENKRASEAVFMKNSVEVPFSDFQMMLLSAFRYSLGRKTYMSSTCAEWLKTYWDIMPEGYREQIHNDIKHAIEHGLAGNDCDVEAWKGLLAI